MMNIYYRQTLFPMFQLPFFINKNLNLIQMRDIYAGQGNFGAQQPFILTFGLGSRKKIDKIEVRWPDKKSSVTVIKNVKINQIIEIGEVNRRCGSGLYKFKYRVA